MAQPACAWWLKALLIVAAAFGIYSPVFDGRWLWDDNYLVHHNPLMSDPAGWWKIWFQPGILIDYFPITFSVQRIEWKMWGDNTLGYHLTNVVLHLAGALLVWRLLAKLGLRLAWIGGLLFAVHPVMVESVAWIAELKNTLALPPLLLAMCFWIDFGESRSSRDYALSLGLFLVAMLCKSTEMMFPVVILLHAWWKKGRIGGNDLLHSAPFFVISLALGALATWLEIHHPGPIHPLEAGWLVRLDSAALQLNFLLGICLCPIHLLPIYPSEITAVPTVIDFLVWLALFVLLGTAWLRRRTWGRHVLLGLGFFLLNVAPILGHTVSRLTIMVWSLDHLLYVPVIGLIGLAVAGVQGLEDMLPSKAAPLIFTMAGLIAALLACESRAYAAVFHDSESLWTYARARNPGSDLVHTNLAEDYAVQGRLAEAVAEARVALALNPNNFPAHDDLATWLYLENHNTEAMAEFEIALRLNPTDALAHFNFGNLLVLAHRLPEAESNYRLSLQFDSQFAPAHAELGKLLSGTNRDPEAFEQFRQAIELDPDLAATHLSFGKALVQANQLPGAIQELGRAVQLDPNDAAARSDLGAVLARTGHLPEAMTQLQAALQLDPNNAGAHNNLGSIFLITGQLSRAADEYQAALRIQPGFAEAQRNLARVQALEKSQGGTKPAP